MRLTFPIGQSDEIMIAPEINALAIGAAKAQGRVLVSRRGPVTQVIAAGSNPYVAAK